MTSDKGGSLRSYRGGGGVASHRSSNVSVISEAKSKSVRSTSASMLLQEAKSKFIISHSSEIKAAKQLGILGSFPTICYFLTKKNYYLSNTFNEDLRSIGVYEAFFIRFNAWNHTTHAFHTIPCMEPYNKGDSMRIYAWNHTTHALYTIRCMEPYDKFDSRGFFGTM